MSSPPGIFLNDAPGGGICLAFNANYFSSSIVHCRQSQGGMSRKRRRKIFKKVVRTAGVEPTTFGFGGRRSIQLSYARNAATIPAQPRLLNCNLTAPAAARARPDGSTP